MRFDGLTPSEVYQIINAHADRWYIEERIGTDEQTRWELNRRRIGHADRQCVVRCYRRAYTDGKWVLSVAGDHVEPRDRNSDDGLVWEYVADTYEQIGRILKLQGARNQEGVLICPELPAVGWCNQYGPYMFQWREQ